MAELNVALDRAEADETVRVILLSGEGKAFSAGFDLDMDGFEPHEAELDEQALRKELSDDFDIIMR